MASFEISVIVCTRNPRARVLEKTLAGLQRQTLAFGKWQLIVIDNGSDQPVCAIADCSWHPNFSCISEHQPGLTQARIGGIRAAEGRVIVFVDDDNWLREDYLSQALRKSEQWPSLGTWGGQLLPVWESVPEPWTKRYWNWLAIRPLDADLWSNVPHHYEAHPYGAGMCVRREVANEYVRQVENDRRRAKLDRNGSSLLGGGDADLNYTATNMGLGCGVFKDLVLEHYMPAFRTSEEYLLRLVEDMTCSSVCVRHVWGQSSSFPSRSARLFNWYRNRFITARERNFELARSRGLRRGLELTISMACAE